MTSLLLKRASASRPSGERRDDDYDMLARWRAVIGRIMKVTPWMRQCFAGRSENVCCGLQSRLFSSIGQYPS